MIHIFFQQKNLLKEKQLNSEKLTKNQFPAELDFNWSNRIKHLNKIKYRVV